MLLIDWCLTQALPVFQLYRGVNKFLSLDTYKTMLYIYLFWQSMKLEHIYSTLWTSKFSGTAVVSGSDVYKNSVVDNGFRMS
jgi:hypothetical protein